MNDADKKDKGFIAAAVGLGCMLLAIKLAVVAVILWAVVELMLWLT